MTRNLTKQQILDAIGRITEFGEYAEHVADVYSDYSLLDAMLAELDKLAQEPNYPH